MQVALALLVVLPMAYCIPFIGSEQSIAVTGKLTCNGKPANDVKVKLYERELVLDKFLDQKTTDSQGRFQLSGHKKEVNIYHKCEYKGPCYKKISVKIPGSFVTQGATPSKTFDIGELNLAGAFSGESTDCLN